MYWNIIQPCACVQIGQLNSNIRCIEMPCNTEYEYATDSWIVTLDVLKFNTGATNSTHISLNSNIRCIEMKLTHCNFTFLFSWIVTLDVLKSKLFHSLCSGFCSWIVTLDVLKYRLCQDRNRIWKLNSNIRCIEIIMSALDEALEKQLNSNIRCIEIIRIVKNRDTRLMLNSNIRCIEMVIREKIMKVIMQVE